MDIVDILIHIHPELSAELRTKMEDEVGTQKGVLSVHFSAKHLHELTVAYDPQAITSQHILELVRAWDKAATMVGL